MVPTEVILHGDQRFPVVQKSLAGKLGYLDRGTGEIALEIRQPEAGKHIVLIHELLHMAAELLVQNKVLRRQPPESFIENAAPILLALLVNSGLYVGIGPEELEKFIEERR